MAIRLSDNKAVKLGCILLCALAFLQISAMRSDSGVIEGSEQWQDLTLPDSGAYMGGLTLSSGSGERSEVAQLAGASPCTALVFLHPDCPWSRQLVSQYREVWGELPSSLGVLWITAPETMNEAQLLWAPEPFAASLWTAENWEQFMEFGLVSTPMMIILDHEARFIGEVNPYDVQLPQLCSALTSGDDSL